MSDQETFRVGIFERKWIAAMITIIVLVVASISFCGCGGSAINRTTLRAVDNTIMTGCAAYTNIVHPLVVRDLAGQSTSEPTQNNNQQTQKWCQLRYGNNNRNRNR